MLYKDGGLNEKNLASKKTDILALNGFAIEMSKGYPR